MMATIQAIFALYRERGDWFLGLLWDHFLLSGQAILLSGSIGLLLGILIAQRPKLAPYIPQMRENLARRMGAEPDQVSVKATTEEGLGFTGAGEGIAAHAVALLVKNR